MVTEVAFYASLVKTIKQTDLYYNKKCIIGSERDSKLPDLKISEKSFQEDTFLIHIYSSPLLRRFINVNL